MDLSGIIFVVLALAWAVYLIPKALKHHDEMARSRSIDRFSTAMRVLARREPVNKRDARLVVTPARTTDRVLRPSAPEPTPHPSSRTATTDTPERRRGAARLAARRRRRVLMVLLLADLVTVVLAATAVLAWWPVAIPAGLTLVWLVLCRLGARREQTVARDTASADRADTHATTERPAAAPRRATRVDAPYGTPQQTTRRTASAAGPEVSPDEETVALDVSALRGGAGLPVASHDVVVAQTETVAVAVETLDGGSLWDPLPVTLPTYVGKAKAARSVRTIDLGSPGTWTSGRDEADTALVEQTAEAADPGVHPEVHPGHAAGTEDAGFGDDQRAVGT